MTDTNGATTYYSFDNANRLTAIDYTDSNDVVFGYDTGGRRTSMTDSVGTTRWYYDALNRPTSIVSPFGSPVDYGYDGAGNRIRMIYPGKDVSYSYDAANRLIEVNDFTKITSYQYDPLGRLSSILRPNGVASTYTYDIAGRLIQLQHGMGEDELASYQYAYDNAGNRTQAVERVKSAGAGPTVHLTVVDRAAALQVGKEVYAFDGTTYTGYHATTDVNGQVAITLPQGSYRFRVDVGGVQFWSGMENHCTIGECDNLLITIPTPILVMVQDSDGNPQANIPVYTFSGTTYTGYHGTTNELGELLLLLPEGSYTLRADFNGSQFWGENSCDVPSCWFVPININLPITVTVLDNIGMPHAGIPVYAFNGTTYTGEHAVTDENGQAQLTLQDGDYRFRADFNGTQFWSGEENHCTVPDCRETGIAVTLPLVVTVMDSGGSPQAGLPVYAFNGTTYTGFNGTTDADGRVTFTLPAGSYRFRADLNGTQFWSDTQNHCTVPECSGAQITVTSSTTVTVQDTEGTAKAGISVYAFNGTTYTGYSTTTNANGQAILTLPQGSYRFRADYNGTQFWSGSANHCDVPGCTSANVTVTNGVLVTVTDTDGAPKAGLKVYAFNGTTYTSYNATTNTNGQATFTLPQGSYRFRADLNGTQFWSDTQNHCAVPGCGSVGITVTNPVTVTVHDTDGTPKTGLKVYAFNGTTYTGYNATTNANGQVTLTLPQGNYRFRTDLNGTQFWSETSNHCDIPGCASADVTVTIPLTVTVQIADGTPQAGLKVYVFNGTTYTGYNATTNASGQTTFTLPQESYRFRADYNGSQYWSGTSNHCTVPGCLALTMIVGPQATPNATLPTATPPTPEPTTTASPTPEATATETPLESGYQPPLALVSSSHNIFRSRHLSIVQPQPQSAPPSDVTVTALDTDASPKEGLHVYVFDETTYTGFNGITDANGQVTFTLPDGNYRFRADLNGTQFWSGEMNHCAVPGCVAVTITVTKPVTVTVQDGTSAPKEGLNVYAFDGDTYTGYHALTDSNGHALLTLPEGSYRFRADLNGTQFWSGETNHCNVTTCESAEVTVSLPVTVSVLDTDSIPKEGLNVYAFDGSTYTGYHQTTDANGQAVFTLPPGIYRFRADLNGTQFWSGDENHCDPNDGCGSVNITVTKPVTVTVADENNAPYANLPIYAFDGNTYTGYHSVTDANGQATLTLPQGSYRFRADLRGTQYWSNPENNCAIPDCESAAVTIPGEFEMPK
jgi:YD repeat-containing protein